MIQGDKTCCKKWYCMKVSIVRTNMHSAGPHCSCSSSNEESDQLANANINRCSQHQVGNIDRCASSGSDALNCLAAPEDKDTATHTPTKALALVDKLESSDVSSADEHVSLPSMRGMGDCNCNTATLEQKKKATSDEQQKEIGVASSDCATETSVSSLNDSRSSSKSLAPNKSENGKAAKKSSEAHPKRSVSLTNDSSSSSTDLLYQALHDRALNDSSSSSSADAGRDQLLSSQEDEAEASRNERRNKSQNLKRIRRKRKRRVHPTAEDQSVSSLNSNSSSSSPVLGRAQCDSSSSSSGSPKPE